MASTTKAVVFQLPIRTVAGSTAVIDSSHQPGELARDELFAGYQGRTSPHEANRSLIPVGFNDELGYQLARIVVRPTAEPIARRTLSDGLKGLHQFDSGRSHVLVHEMLGKIWLDATKQVYAHSTDLAVSISEVDWNSAYDYISRFPLSVSRVFEMLPDLEIIIAQVKSNLTQDYEQIAVMPLIKVQLLVEEAYIKNRPTRIALRRTSVSGEEVIIRLPGKTAPTKWEPILPTSKLLVES